MTQYPHTRKHPRLSVSVNAADARCSSPLAPKSYEHPVDTPATTCGSSAERTTISSVSENGSRVVVNPPGGAIPGGGSEFVPRWPECDAASFSEFEDSESATSSQNRRASAADAHSARDVDIVSCVSVHRSGAGARSRRAPPRTYPRPEKKYPYPYDR